MATTAEGATTAPATKAATSARHLRSRTGCWVCRLRKKKCDESRPTCRQCANLRIQCDGYEDVQPVWMRDEEAARKKKEEIKFQIGKRGRRRKKAQAREEMVRINGSGGADGGASKEDEKTQPPGCSVADHPRYDFVTYSDYGIPLLNGFEWEGRKYDFGLLGGQELPDGCHRCPVRCSSPPAGQSKGVGYSSRSPVQGSGNCGGFENMDTRAKEILLENINSNILVVGHGPPPLLPPSSPSPLAARSFGKRVFEGDEITESDHKGPERSRSLSISTITINAFSASRFSDPYLATPMELCDDQEVSLVKHFVRYSFPHHYQGMAEPIRHECLREIVVPLMCSSPSFLRGCMSNSAIHLSYMESDPKEKEVYLDQGSERMIECIGGLRKALSKGSNLEGTLASVLSLVAFEASSNHLNWEPHVAAAIECLVRLNYLNRPVQTTTSKFMASRVIWIDILSACTLGRAPELWASYRKILSRPSHEHGCFGLLEVMGCDDTVMYLLSEVMCIEQYKLKALDDGNISWEKGKAKAIELDRQLKEVELPMAVLSPMETGRVEPEIESENGIQDGLGMDEGGKKVEEQGPSASLGIAEPMLVECEEEGDTSPRAEPSSPTSSTPATSPESSPTSSPAISHRAASSPATSATYIPTLSNNSFPLPPQPPPYILIRTITAAYRNAARIHLWANGLGYFPRLGFLQSLLEELIVILSLLPARANRTVGWPILIGGCLAITESDREFFLSKCQGMEVVAKIMREVWRRRDRDEAKWGIGVGAEVHWRNVMRECGWEVLLA
ncbi:hypothetical protein L873DRAFT_1788072 [Choiromyces venosus 120613-1]|uniref:Zn(2)-C6 fungal-type domain-containing protein n=1 Tax=Choiromyces venosus 120613-1 TaxID=1336337 RepID=A0A3N4JTN5_9PEZI|nr:hypothetical protein L873DRAFT_1788072 [Choiromyces venosus 120613-1]